MALLFPWATKEYLLWEMTIGQIIFYINKAYDVKENKKESDWDEESIKAFKEDMRRQYGEIGS